MIFYSVTSSREEAPETGVWTEVSNQVPRDFINDDDYILHDGERRDLLLDILHFGRRRGFKIDLFFNDYVALGIIYYLYYEYVLLCQNASESSRSRA